MKLALLQLNPIVGDIAGNKEKILTAYGQAKDMGADLCVAPEMATIGYPPRDILLIRDVVRRNIQAAEEIAAATKSGPALVLGMVDFNPEGGSGLFNCAALLRGGRIEAKYAKRLLPSYDVFDEKRYFDPGQSLTVARIDEMNVALTVCEDIWNDSRYLANQSYPDDPVKLLEDQNVDLLINISASPFTVGKQAVREDMLSGIASRLGSFVAYCNQAGGNDDLIFDGRSTIFAQNGWLMAKGAGFGEDVVMADLSSYESVVVEEDYSPESEALSALILGTRDYVHKSGFAKAAIGLSGGVDSALTATIASMALGPKNVTGVLMPSPYSSDHSVDDSLELAANLGIKTYTVPIESGMKAFDAMLAEPFAGLEPDVTEENIQARIRGTLLMAIANKSRALLLTTGNKSELSVGYCTIYGDMAGALAVISDVTKTMVYSICKWINMFHGPMIPENIITKAPSAELRPGQTDQDSLPPYDLLDEILTLIIESHLTAPEIIAKGYNPDVVNKVWHLVKISEFKRRQAAPGLKITSQAFGIGWRMPLACRI